MRRLANHSDLLWIVLLGLLLLALSFIVPKSCRGEVIVVDEFRGLATDLEPQSLAPMQARKSVGWLYADGELYRQTFDRRTTEQFVPYAVKWMGLYSPGYEIL